MLSFITLGTVAFVIIILLPKLVRMWSFVFYCLNIINIFALISCYKLDDFDLPGLFSNAICTNQDFRGTLAPLCACKQQWNVNNIQSLCTTHKEFGQCIETDIMKNTIDEATKKGYVHLVFGKGRFRQNIEHLCHKQTDGVGIASCSTPSVVRQCNAKFESELLHYLTEETACRKTEELSRCFWDSLKPHCSASTTYFWSKLAESYLGRRCSKYGKGRTSTCRNIEKAFHPKQNTISVKECLNAVHTMKECLILERLESIHHEDIWANIDFEVDNYVHFETLRCEILAKRRTYLQVQCEASVGDRLTSCGVAYTKGMTAQIETIKHGKNVTSEEICLLYTNITDCYNGVLKNCTGSFEYFSAILCAWMPARCHCQRNELKIGELSSVNTGNMFISLSAVRLFIMCAFYFLVS